MKDIKYKIIYFLILTLISVSFTRCKSVEFTILGFFNKKFSEETNQNSDTVSITKKDINLCADTLMKTKSVIADTSKYQVNGILINISGLITDTLNKPIEEARIYIIKGNQIVAYANSDINGKYSITKIFQPISNFIDLQMDTFTEKQELDTSHPNEYKILVSAIGFRNETKKYIISPNDNIKLNYKLYKLCSISGVVTMNDKNPVKDAVVLLKSNNKSMSAITNKNGEFLLNQLDEGRYTISVLHEKLSFPTKIIDLYSGTDYKGVEFICSAGGIRGLIKGTESNNPIQDAIITVQKMDIINNVNAQTFQITYTSENNGSYSIEGINAGKYRIQIDAMGYGSLVKEVEIFEDQMQKGVDFNLTQEGIILGQLINYDPKEKIIITLATINKSFNKSNNIDIKEDGKYVIKGISAGTYTIVIKWKTMLFSRDSINVIAGKETKDINIILEEATGNISGRIVSKSNNEPVENAIIIASSEKSGNFTFSDKQGNYKISGLLPGIYELSVIDLNYKTSSKSKLSLEKEIMLKNIDFDLTQKK